MRDLIASIEAEYRRYKTLAEGAINQLADSQLAEVAGSGNSIVTIVWHLAGNLKSRFTDFLTSDGEKPWRDRDSEFLARAGSRKELQAKWEDGWRELFAALPRVSEADLPRAASIPGPPPPAVQALHPSPPAARYHVGHVGYL